MDAIISLASHVPDWIADLIDALFRAPFWKVMAGVVIVTLSLFALSVLSSAGRDKMKAAALLGALALAAFGLFRPFDRGFPLG